MLSFRRSEHTLPCSCRYTAASCNLRAKKKELFVFDFYAFSSTLPGVAICAVAGVAKEAG